MSRFSQLFKAAILMNNNVGWVNENKSDLCLTADDCDSTDCSSARRRYSINYASRRYR